MEALPDKKQKLCSTPRQRAGKQERKKERKRERKIY
jgi:hypothetical protein